MSDILIKDVDLQYAETGGLIFRFYGVKNNAIETPVVAMIDGYTGDCLGFCKVQELPPHGQLKDADEMFRMLERSCFPDSLEYTIAIDILKGLIKNAPTVIEANK